MSYTVTLYFKNRWKKKLKEYEEQLKELEDE